MTRTKAKRNPTPLCKTMYEYVISERTKRRAEKRNVLVYSAEANSEHKIEVYNDGGLFMFFIGTKGREYARQEFKVEFAEDLKVRKSRRWWQYKLRVW